MKNIFSAILGFLKKLFGQRAKSKVHKPNGTFREKSIALGSPKINYGNIAYKMSCRSSQKKRRKQQRRTGNYKKW